MQDTLTISEISRRSGVASSALRFYEDRGLIQSQRAGSGHRRYPRAVLRRIAFIVFAQRMGLSLDEIGEELSKLPHNRVPERADWAKLSGKWTQRIDQRIAELERKIERAGFFLRGSHHAHAFHSPYWWLKCAYGLDNPEAAPVKRYHEFLCMLIERQPRWAAITERALNPVLGKSVVVYGEKVPPPADRWGKHSLGS